MSERRPILVVVGYGDKLKEELELKAQEIGHLGVDAGFRVATGGLGGIMAAVSKGARGSTAYREGDVIGVLPGYDGDSVRQLEAVEDHAVSPGVASSRTSIA